MRPPTHVLAGLVLAVLVGACSGTANSGSSATTTPPGTPTSSTGVHPPTSAAPDGKAGPPADGQGVQVMRFFIRDGVVAPGERYIVAASDPKVDVLRSLANPLTDTEKAAGLMNGVPEGENFVKSLKIDNGTATLDVTRPFETRETPMQVAQVVYTLTQFPDISKVKFLVEGQDNGATGVPPIGRDGVGRYLPDVLVDSPWPTMKSPHAVKVSGDLDPRFSSLEYRLEDPFGTEIAKGSITAKFGTGRKKFDTTIEVPPSTTGALTLVVTPPAGSRQPPFRIPFNVTG